MKSKQKIEVRSILDWPASVRGEPLVALQKEQLREILPRFHGVCLLEISPFDLEIKDYELAIQQRYRIKSFGGDTGDVIAEPDKLPFRENSIDVVCLNHGLDVYENPHQQLREACRVVVPNGYILVQGFNPFSLWGAGHYLLGFKRRFPWASHFLSHKRIEDWLTLLDFHTESVTFQGFYWPTNVKWLQSAFRPFEFLGAASKLPFGASYTLIARKMVGGMTQIRPKQSGLIPKGIRVPSPTARVKQD